jgi:hypothetical protein
MELSTISYQNLNIVAYKRFNPEKVIIQVKAIIVQQRNQVIALISYCKLVAESIYILNI